jgi:phenylpyruvate tautomerase PptA (4-oxalocrotonate tautomerase family)
MTKLEEVARAVLSKWQEPSNDETVEQIAEQLARAAVEALRVPNETIVGIILDYDEIHTHPGALWTSLIDAILREKP